MSSTVRVQSKLCDKVSTITVSMTLEGDFLVKIESDCVNVQHYAEGIQKLSMDDLVDKRNSLVFQRFFDVSMSANCLVPAGLMSAGWLEAGMVSRSRALKVGDSRVEYLE